MWRARPADVARESPRGCDVALRPRGRGTGGQRGAHGRADAWQEATVTRPRGRLCGAPRGRQVGGGPTGIVGPWLVFRGGNALA